jgi:hypothetical protein
MDYTTNRAWADQWMPAAIATIAPHMIAPAPMMWDTERGTDLRLVRARDLNVAVRVRRPNGYVNRYPWEITIRCKGRGEGRTEWDKVMLDGWADWYFYAHASDAFGVFARWMLLDLAGVRGALISGDASWREQPNNDGTRFRAIDVRTVPRRSVIASSHALPVADAQQALAF